MCSEEDTAECGGLQGYSPQSPPLASSIFAYAQEHCSFDGAWRGRPPSKLRTYYVSSYFWDRATESGIIKEASAVSWPASIKVGEEGPTEGRE